MRTLAVAVACLGLGIVAAGCGGSKPPSVANLGTTTVGTTTGSSTRPSNAAFASCVTLDGFTAVAGSAASASSRSLHVGGLTFTGNVDPSSPQFRQAMQACRKYMPGGGPQAMSPSQQAEWETAMAKFAACMRRSGAPNFPTPQLPGKGPAPTGSDLNSPLVNTAFKTCQSLEPKVGPRISLG